ncbi:long-chain-acyl-CoA synthetase [Oceanicoccus sagamiensis]|uniref:Long-chain-acyl-CoA synthetase n=1 Tax=Oceanicoccus sagamiensis TaxID=716816 RepID=A0A1X9NDH6_9GAMM|nr:long-chain-acyl-CoA synthetase [Oceanicoccus sagamiensis]ARN75211.1 long-chain-acyl-CoA synthetase [Oceanicoccus sagamiensis]
MSSIKEIFRVLKDFITIAPVIAGFKPPKDNEAASMGLLFQNTAEKYADKSALIFEGRELTWGQYNSLANQYAHLLKQQGVKRGDVVSVLMENRIEMLAAMMGLAKIGATAALINTSLKGKPLIHCITITKSSKCLLGEELAGSIEEVKSELGLTQQDYFWVKDSGFNPGLSGAPDWAYDFSADIEAMPTNNPPETVDIKAGEKALYIFTSGTTGLPKAAVIYHRRILASSIPYCKAGMRAKPQDRLYLCLPLYHITGLGPGYGSSLVSGASVFLRRRFSASQFWPEVQQYQTNLFVYVGELCRYLAMQPECPEEKNNPIQTMLGNGLRPDVWDQFRSRFKVDRITEIYGSSEGNAAFLNILNKDRTIGTSSASLMLVKYDVDADEMVRDSAGKLVETEKGEPGLLLSEIDAKYIFDGYENKEATNSKILTDVKKPGDRWFNTGDLIREIDVGFAMGLPHFQFVDRVGDTFRWRAENVSTNEVGEIINTFDAIEITNVYGVEVPGAEGKAGMAAITLKAGEVLDIQAFSEFIDRELPPHARPVFVRIQPQQETTVTFKLVKGTLRKEAYHLDQLTDPVYILKPKSQTYQPLDQASYETVMQAKAGF